MQSWQAYKHLCDLKFPGLIYTVYIYITVPAMEKKNIQYFLPEVWSACEVHTQPEIDRPS